MTQNEKMADIRSALQLLIKTLQNAYNCMVETGMYVRDEPARQFFQNELRVRSEFVAQLEAELHRLSQGEVESHPTHDDRTLLVAAERREEEVKMAYEKTLQAELPTDIRDLLSNQEEHVTQAQMKVRDLLNSVPPPH